MQPPTPASAARKRRTAPVELSSPANNPQAKVPPARKAVLRPAQRSMRRYFPLDFGAVGSVSVPAGKSVPPAVAFSLSTRFLLPFFVGSTFFATRTAIVPNVGSQVSLVNVAR
jgi:hypothetical protein